MQFNTDPKKQANEVIFSRKSNNCSHPSATFSNIYINKYPHGKLLGIVLDTKLDFKFHVDQKIKCNKLIALIRKLSVIVARKALLTVYESFIRPHVDYGDVLYDIPENKIFRNELEKVQYRACLAVLVQQQKKKNSLFSVYNPLAVKLLTCLRLQFSHLKEHRFTCGFGDTASPMCGYNAEIETLNTSSCIAIFILLNDSNS